MAGIDNPFWQTNSEIHSLNRAWLVDLPGVELDEGVQGRNGFELLAARSLAQMAAEAGLPPMERDSLQRLDNCFEDPATRPQALALARQYGRRLGFLLLMLQRGDPCNRAARPSWDDRHWAYWASIRHVFLGGGLLSGALGPPAVEAAQELLSENGAGHLRLALASSPAALPLAGMVRAAPPGAGQMLLLDFGHTSIKRAWAYQTDRPPVRLELLPSLPSFCPGDPYDTSLPAVREHWERMLDVILSTWSSAAVDPPAAKTAISISLASYLAGGHPIGGSGCYDRLRHIAPNLQRFAERNLAAYLPRLAGLTFWHDGTAAALAYTGVPQSAVLLLGTAIGNGFPPPQP